MITLDWVYIFAGLTFAAVSILTMSDRDAAFNGVIRAQLPTAAALLVINTLLMYFLAFRF